MSWSGALGGAPLAALPVAGDKHVAQAQAAWLLGFAGVIDASGDAWRGFDGEFGFAGVIDASGDAWRDFDGEFGFVADAQARSRGAAGFAGIAGFRARFSDSQARSSSAVFTLGVHAQTEANERWRSFLDAKGRFEVPES